MSASLWKVASSNAFNTSLNGNIGDSDSTITLTTTTGLTAPGILVIDRQDSEGTNTPAKREYISYSGIIGNDITGVTRGLSGSSAQTHSSGAIVEETFTVKHWGDLQDYLLTSHDSSGNIVSSNATISTLRLSTHLNMSGASVTGLFPINPTWVFEASASVPSTGIGKTLSMPQDGSWTFFSAILNAPASGSTIIIDVNKNGSSIFDSGTRLMIAGGGTFASTASIATKSFSSGNSFNVDVDQIGNTIKNVGITVTGRS